MLKTSRFLRLCTVMKPEKRCIVAAMVGALVVLSSSSLADEHSKTVEDVFFQRAAARAALAVQAEECKARSKTWLRSVLGQIALSIRLQGSNVADMSKEEFGYFGLGIMVGAVSGAKGDTGGRKPGPSDFEWFGKEEMAQELRCQIIEYRKTDLLMLDAIAGTSRQ